MAAKNNLINTPQKEEREVITLPHYAPCPDITKDYVLLDKVDSFTTNFESLCRRFIKETNPDHNNGSYFDAVIDKYCKEAIEDIDLQRQEHIQLFTQSVTGYQKGIKIKAMAKLQMIERSIDEVESELKKCQRVFYEGTSMED